MFVNCSGTTEIVCTYFDDFQLYVNYYGDTDYADKWVLASSYAEQTNYSSGRGDADFALTQGTRGRARAETLQTATVALNIWMAIIQELEYATRNCASDSDSAVHSLDAAVAFYTGSLEGTSGTGSGILLHQLADEKASKMKTTKWAGNDVRGTAYVNLELFYHFGEMQDAIVGGACDTAASLKTDIIRLMKIPLIQGVVLDAWIRANDEDEPDVEEAKSRGATYAAAILPYVESCDPARAAVVYNNMRIGATDNDFDFSTLKTAIESVYDCLNIKCAEVGGVWSTRASEFEAGAAPCNDGKPIIARFTEAPTASPTASPTTISPTSSPTAAPSSTPVASGSSTSASKLGQYAILSFGTLAALAL